jgi:hypothetical protein
MTALEVLIEPYKEWVMNDASLLNDVAQLVHKNANDEYTIDEIKNNLTEIIENNIQTEVAEVVVIEEVVSNTPTINTGRFEGLNRNERERVMTLLRMIEGIIKNNAQGITKTGILKAMRKDNSHWRKEVGKLLNYLLIDELIQLNGRNYHPMNIIVKSRERKIHRNIYELLSQNSMTLTDIYKATGTNGGKSREIVKSALKDLQNEGYIVLENRRWRWS